ncbi:MAG: glucosaminidase domain-containing protein [Chitinophagaceae bacterium]|nr:glucosaminidase domain-containing protein [Chitinophagaceae bacterium]
MKKIISLLTILSINSIILMTQIKPIDSNINKEILYFTGELNDLTKLEILYFEILYNNIAYPDIVFAQAVLESGYMGSEIFQENNNLFGMRMPERRPTIAIRNNKGYALYDCWCDSVKDYKMFQDFSFRKSQKTREEYFGYLGRIYAEDSSYVFFVRKIAEENKEIFQLNNQKIDIYTKYINFRRKAYKFCFTLENAIIV